MKTLTTDTAAALARAVLQPIVLVILTTYTSRAAATVDKIYYFASAPVLYDYGNTGTVRQFEPFLIDVSDLVESMSHVPQTRAAGLAFELRIKLANTSYRGGDRLIQELRAHHVTFAYVEVATVYGTLDEATGWYDLRGLAGDEHIVDFRGEILMPEAIDDQSFQLACASREIAVPWLLADDPATVDPRDLGIRLPVPVGAARSVSAVGWSVGWSTTLVGVLAASVGAGGIVELTDVTGLASSGTLWIDAEKLTYSSLDSVSRTVTLSARGAGGTAVVDHQPGAFVVEEVAEAVWVLSAKPLSAVRDLYVRSPYTGEKTRVPSALAYVVLEDTALISGETCTTLRVPAAGMASIQADLYRAARVTQQPEFADAGTYQEQDASPNVGAFTGYSSPVASDFINYNGSASSPQFSYQTGAPWQSRAYALTFSGTLPTINAIDCEILADVVWNTSGLLGTFSLLLGHNGMAPTFPYSHYTIPCSANSTSSGVPWSTGKVAHSFVPSALGPHVFNLYPQTVVSAGTKTTSHMIGLSNLRARFGYNDSGGIYRTVDVAITAASLGFGLEWYADVNGPTVPPLYENRYAFDSTTGFSASGCTISADTSNKTEGAASLRLTAVETVIEDFESASGWSTAGGVTAALDTGLKTEGSGSIYASGGGSDLTTSTRQIFKSALSPIDCSGMLLAVDVRMTQAMWDYLALYGLTPTTGLLVGVTSDSGYATDWKQWVFGSNHVPRGDEWFTLVFDPATWPAYSQAGTLDLANVRGYQFGFAPTVVGVTTGFYWDRFRLLPKTMIAQLNATTGTLDLSADADTYALDARKSAVGDVIEAKVYFSEAAGSGTTQPADRKEIVIAIGDVGVGAFGAIEAIATDVGSPGTVDDVETVGVAVTLPTSPQASLIDVPEFWVDHLAALDEAANPYTATTGDPIENPADVVRWVNEALCDQSGDFCDVATFAAAGTNLASVKLAVDLRLLGTSWVELMERLGYESRANLIRSEAVGGPRLKMFAADASYLWPAASGDTITEAEKRYEVGRDGRELSTRFEWVYGRDLSRGDDMSAYDLLVRANPVTSDVGVSASTLATLEAEWGRRDASVGVFLAIQDEASAEDVAGYYVAEATRTPAGVIVLERVAWWQVPGIEIGDVRSVSLPWRSASVKSRVIEVRKAFRSGLVDLRLVEVS